MKRFAVALNRNSLYRPTARCTQARINTTTSTSSCRYYHSYPNPDEKPVITQAKSTTTKTLDKYDISYNLDKKFRLDKAFPGIVSGQGIHANNYPKTHITKLKNGIRVASQDLPSSLMSSFAVIIDSGSSSENQAPGPESTHGACHAIELTAFRGVTANSKEEITTAIEKLGGSAQCVSSRESLLFCVDVLRGNSMAALEILSDAVLTPNVTVEGVEDCKQIMTFQQNEFPGELLSRDAITLAAYKGSPLGNDHLCPPSQIDTISLELMQRYRSKYFVGENMVISGAGVDHETLVSYVEKKFSTCRTIGDELFQALKATTVKSVYTGGILMNQRELKEPYIKVAIGFEVGGWRDDQFVAACVLQQLLGGGSSFSAGGPGKGMYTRLYRQVLNRYHWVEAAEAFVLVNNDSGVLGIDGSCMPDDTVKMVECIMNELIDLASNGVSDEELNRAKNMLRSMMMMQLESRLVVCEDIGRQVSTFGQRKLPIEVGEEIQRITKDDIINVARRMMRSKPVVGCVGSDLSHVPPYHAIDKALESVRSHFNEKS